MRKITIALLLMMSMGTMAQNKAVSTQRNITIAPTKEAAQNTRKNVVLNASDFIPIRKGDIIELKPTFTALPRQHQLLKGVLKSAAAFALTYQVNKAVNNNGKGGSTTPQTATNLAPAIGIGLVAGLPDMLQGLKNKKSYLIYSTYDANKVPIATQKILLKKQNNSYTFDKATADGFVKATILGNGKKVRAGNLSIVISEQIPVSFNGQIAGEFDLSSFGDCQGGGGDDGPPCTGTCIAIYNCEFQKCTAGYKASRADCDRSYPTNSLLDLLGHFACNIAAHNSYSDCKKSAVDGYVACSLN
jgi:hypothetical protein